MFSNSRVKLVVLYIGSKLLEIISDIVHIFTPASTVEEPSCQVIRIAPILGHSTDPEEHV